MWLGRLSSVWLAQPEPRFAGAGGCAVGVPIQQQTCGWGVLSCFAESRQVDTPAQRVLSSANSAVPRRAWSATHLHGGEHAARRAEQIRLVNVGAKAVAAGDATK